MGLKDDASQISLSMHSGQAIQKDGSNGMVLSGQLYLATRFAVYSLARRRSAKCLSVSDSILSAISCLTLEMCEYSTRIALTHF